MADRSLQDQLTSRQITKTDLEIENIRKKNRLESFAPLAPWFASFLTVLTLVLGWIQFQRQQSSAQTRAINEQERDRITRLQDQMRNDVNEISRFTTDTHLTLSTVLFLLDDMKILIASAQTVSDAQSSKAFRSYERTVTNALIEQIVEDADFIKNRRDVTFANIVLNKWDDYKAVLSNTDQQETLDRILYRYVRAMRSIRQKNPSYVKNVSYNADAGYSVPGASEQSSDEEDLWQHFLRIVEGFRDHVTLISNVSVKRGRIQRFEDALCNKSVAQFLFGADFIFRPCMTP